MLRDAGAREGGGGGGGGGARRAVAPSPIFSSQGAG